MFNKLICKDEKSVLAKEENNMKVYQFTDQTSFLVSGSAASTFFLQKVDTLGLYFLIFWAIWMIGCSICSY